MFGTLVGMSIVFGAGLVVGWFMLPAPAFVQAWWSKITGWVSKPAPVGSTIIPPSGG